MSELRVAAALVCIECDMQWSYGVTCWEVFTAGEIPYPGIHPKEVVELLEDGGHLKRPKNQALSDNM